MLVTVFKIDGSIVEEIERTVFINNSGERIVRYAKAEHKLRKKRGRDNCIMLSAKK